MIINLSLVLLILALVFAIWQVVLTPRGVPGAWATLFIVIALLVGRIVVT